MARHDEFSWAPDYDKVRMATAIASGKATKEVRDLAARILQTHEEVKRLRAAKSDRETAQANAHQAVLDSDVALYVTPKPVCRASVRNYQNKCAKNATHIRTWTTEATTGFTLDGVTLGYVDGHSGEGGKWVYGYWTVPGEWFIGKGFTDRPLTDEEDERREPINVEEVHTINLCGTHRRQRGSYGMPY